MTQDVAFQYCRYGEVLYYRWLKGHQILPHTAAAVPLQWLWLTKELHHFVNLINSILTEESCIWSEKLIILWIDIEGLVAELLQVYQLLVQKTDGLWKQNKNIFNTLECTCICSICRLPFLQTATTAYFTANQFNPLLPCSVYSCRNK